MTITILASAFEQYEQPNELAAFEIDSVDFNKGLSHDQLSRLVDHLQPFLVAKDLELYRYLSLRFLVNGIPVLEQRWSTGTVEKPLDSIALLRHPRGSHLTLMWSLLSEIETFRL